MCQRMTMTFLILEITRVETVGERAEMVPGWPLAPELVHYCCWPRHPIPHNP